MGLFDWGKKKQPTLLEVNEPKAERLHFSAPFINVGKNVNVSKSSFGQHNYTRDGYVPFSLNYTDNMFPNYLENCYYLSPMHQNCIDFKTSAIAGEGMFTANFDQLKAEDKIKIKAMEKLNNFDAFINRTVKNFTIHETYYIEVDMTQDIPKLTVLDCSRVRIDSDKRIATIADDWSKLINLRRLPIWNFGNRSKHFIWMFQNPLSISSDVYVLPSYNAILNDIEAEQTITALRPYSLKNGIFSSTALLLPYEITSEKESNDLREMLYNNKGMESMNKWLVMSGDHNGNLPKIEQLKIADGLDGLFKENSEEIRNRIMTAHKIHPSFIQSIAGQLGGNQELLVHYGIFNINYANPMRKLIKNDIQDLFDLMFDNIDIQINGVNYEEVFELIAESKGNNN